MVLTDKMKLKLMDKVVHEQWQANPIAYELKRASHRHGGRDHDKVLANAFAGMHTLLAAYAAQYEITKRSEETSKENSDGQPVDNNNNLDSGNSSGDQIDHESDQSPQE